MKEINQRYRYESQELDHFAEARNYRKYWYSRAKPFLPSGLFLEIGSGIGSNAEVLFSPKSSYLGVEPDGNLVALSKEKFPKLRFEQGTSRDCQKIGSASSIFYLDVLEHIENDKEELEYVCSRMKKEAFLVVLVPAHQYLFSEFDRYVGHWRRYSSFNLEEILPKKLRLIHIEYLDSIGFLLSLFSNKLLKGKLLNQKSVKLWDKLVPISRKLDCVLGHNLGKSILMVAQKKE